MSYFNWWSCGVCGGVILGVTVIVYIQDNVSWAVADIILALVMCISVAIVLFGRKFYRYRSPKGSPLTPMFQVLVAAYFKRKLPYPSNYKELYEISLSQKREKRLLSHTDKLRFLDKAAIIENKSDEIAFATERQNKWRLATVTQIEEMKLVLSIIPIWLATLPFGMCVAQTSTFFIKQGSIMNRTITKSYEIPPASLYSFAAIIMIISVLFYDKVLVPSLRKITKNERGVSILQRIGIRMVLATIVSAIVEHKRLRSQSLLSVFWLVPQFMILGIGDAFTIVGLQEYFYDQVPDTMRSLGIAFYLSVMGASKFLSIFLINLVDSISKRGSGEGWIGKDLNKSRLDLFYWILAAINVVNLGVYAYLAAKYSYKKVLGQGQGKVGIATTEREYDEENITVWDQTVI